MSSVGGNHNKIHAHQVKLVSGLCQVLLMQSKARCEATIFFAQLRAATSCFAILRCWVTSEVNTQFGVPIAWSSETQIFQAVDSTILSRYVLDTGCIIVLQVPHVHITSSAQRSDEVWTHHRSSSWSCCGRPVRNYWAVSHDNMVHHKMFTW